MASDLIEIELEATTVEARGRIAGVVRLPSADGKLEKAKRLSVKVVCRIHGSGNEERIEDPLEFQEGPFAPGHELRFESTLSKGPLSWQGKYVKVDWFVRVELDVPWALDPHREQPFLVVPKRLRAGHGISRAS
jgi:hypothetical protein